MPVALARSPGGLMRWRSNAVVRRHIAVLEPRVEVMSPSRKPRHRGTEEWLSSACRCPQTKRPEQSTGGEERTAGRG